MARASTSSTSPALPLQRELQIGGSTEDPVSQRYVAIELTVLFVGGVDLKLPSSTTIVPLTLAVTSAFKRQIFAGPV
jgi:hypothetical protein